MNRISLLLLVLGAFASLVAAASAPTFCKCTCFTNSTIIEIKSKSSSTSSSSHLVEPPTDANTDSDPAASNPPAEPLASADQKDTTLLDNVEEQDPTTTDPLLIPRSHAGHRRAQTSSPSCNQCNRAFCLSQSLPICKGAGEKDVVTMCFQRDSRKDQIIVWGFILGTAGLLGWAALRKVLDMQENGGIAASIASGLVRGGGVSGIGGGGGGAGGGVVGPSGGVSVGRAAVGSTGRDLGRGQYTTVAGHSRESSGVP